VWNIIYWPVIFLSLVSIVQQIVTLMYPDRIKFYSAMKLITNGGSVAILYLVTRVNDILVIAPGVSDPWEFAKRCVSSTWPCTTRCFSRPSWRWWNALSKSADWCASSAAARQGLPARWSDSLR